MNLQSIISITEVANVVLFAMIALVTGHTLYVVSKFRDGAALYSLRLMLISSFLTSVFSLSGSILYILGVSAPVLNALFILPFCGLLYLFWYINQIMRGRITLR